MNNGLLRREQQCCGYAVPGSSSPGDLCPHGGGGDVLPASCCGEMWRSGSEQVELRSVGSCGVCWAVLYQGCGSGQLCVHPKAPGVEPPAFLAMEN